MLESRKHIRSKSVLHRFCFSASGCSRRSGSRNDDHPEGQTPALSCLLYNCCTYQVLSRPRILVLHNSVLGTSVNTDICCRSRSTAAVVPQVFLWKYSSISYEYSITEYCCTWYCLLSAGSSLPRYCREKRMMYTWYEAGSISVHHIIPRTWSRVWSSSGLLIYGTTADTGTTRSRAFGTHTRTPNPFPPHMECSKLFTAQQQSSARVYHRLKWNEESTAFCLFSLLPPTINQTSLRTKHETSSYFQENKKWWALPFSCCCLAVRLEHEQKKKLLVLRASY